VINNLPRGDIIKRIFDFIEMICELSLQNEKNRGEAFEQIVKRIE